MLSPGLEPLCGYPAIGRLSVSGVDAAPRFVNRRSSPLAGVVWSHVSSSACRAVPVWRRTQFSVGGLDEAASPVIAAAAAAAAAAADSPSTSPSASSPSASSPSASSPAASPSCPARRLALLPRTSAAHIQPPALEEDLLGGIQIVAVPRKERSLEEHKRRRLRPAHCHPPSSSSAGPVRARYRASCRVGAAAKRLYASCHTRRRSAHAAR